MGVDDANDGPGECPGHEFVLTQLLVVEKRLKQVQVCRWCGTPAL